MNQNDNKPFQKITSLLNTSSETFMLIALISLFALPIVIAKNLEPIVSDAEQAGRNAPVARIISTPAPTAAQVATNESNVLGISTEKKALTIVEEDTNLLYFDTANSNYGDETYTLEVSTRQKFGRIGVLKLKNDTQEKQTYKFNVENLEKSTVSKPVLFVDTKEFKIGTKSLPDYITLDPSNEVQFSLLNNQGGNTNIKISVEISK